MKRILKRKPRGQAAVELALAGLVFVTILVIGIHFGEVGYASLKVQEATQSALWDTTAYKMHDMGILYDTSPSGQAISQALSDANQRYSDFDGRTSANGAATILLARTQASNMQVQCTPGTAPGYSAVNLFTWVSYSDNGGVSCSAQADLAPRFIPTSFVDASDGIFTEQHSQNRNITACGLGRASGGACSGEYRLLIDDWGLAEEDEADICPAWPFGVPCIGMNMPFYWAVSKVYVLNGAGQGTAGSELAEATVGTRPMFPNEQWFYMSYTGEEALFQQPIPFGEGMPTWDTTPFAFSMPTYLASWIQRRNRGGCYLGLNCNSPNGSAP
ncbi:MAG: pilus assembly protein [Myxococcales bacterium]|nr:pilus assembly protein [Myxococcales bacterium]